MQMRKREEKRIHWFQGLSKHKNEDEEIEFRIRQKITEGETGEGKSGKNIDKKMEETDEGESERSLKEVGLES